MSPPPLFAVIHGNRDVVRMLEDTLELARGGRLVGVVICGIGNDETSGWQWAYKDGLPFPWPRFVTITSIALSELLKEGLEPDPEETTGWFEPAGGGDGDNGGGCGEDDRS
jgi:hypothetical protein